MAKREERHVICIVGRTNVGKSSLLNVLSGQRDYAIVDSTPGTTADTVTALMEIHDVGPCKILDTAGVDEDSVLGEKKRRKTYEALEEADLTLVVVDLERAARGGDLSVERQLLRRVREAGKQSLIVYNLFRNRLKTGEQPDVLRATVDDRVRTDTPAAVVDALDPSQQGELAAFIAAYFQRETREADLLPSVRGKGYVLLIIPMDEETPALRLLRPQDMAVERLLRAYAIPVLFRMDLAKARSSSPRCRAAERRRYEQLLRHLQRSGEGLQLVITDSQAFDVVARWTPAGLPLTSFSIMMTHYMSFGHLSFFLEGVRAVNALCPGDRVLVVEACNHNRKCDDIGTVQIPRRLDAHVGGALRYSFNFGRTFPDDLGSFRLIVHCGACMIDRQKYWRRLELARRAKVPVTNYGILLSFLQGERVLRRAVKPFLPARVKRS